MNLLQTNNLVRVIAPADEDLLIFEIEQIRKALSVDPTLGATEALKKGRMIRIINGPFRGVEGLIQTLKNETTVCLNVDMIGQAVHVEVDKDYIELLD
jgi:transcription antitermination factor NusG